MKAYSNAPKSAAEGDNSTPEEQIHPEQRERITGKEFQHKRGIEREKAVEQPVPGMEHTDLTVTVKVKAIEDAGIPEKGVAALQALVKECAKRKMVGREIVFDEDLSSEERPTE